jgi:hypothetical protein
MQDNKEDKDKRETEEPETDTEGHSMFLYEAARQMTRQHEREAQEAGRQAKLLKQSKEQKRR